MINMIRTIHPVGQGGFISEKFVVSGGKETVVVYDCGSQNGKSIVEREIRNCFQQNAEIRAVYISHLDNDHVNGLEFLINYCRVKNIYLPYLSPQARLMSMIKYKCDEESGTDDLCSDFIWDLIDYGTNERLPESLFLLNREPPRIHFVNQNNFNIQKVDVENTDIWEYLAFNNENVKIKRRFLEMLEKEGIYPEQLRDAGSFSYLWGKLKIRNALKKIYKKLDDGINANSLGVISYPLTASCKSRINCGCLKCKHCILNCWETELKTGAIYVGDMDLSDMKSDFYINRFRGNSIGLLQLPHHGSKNNYRTECTENIDVFIANAGYSNRYGHPSGLVADDLLINGKELHTITEKPGSRYREHIIIEY